MKKFGIRFSAFLVCLVMLLAMFAVSAFAIDTKAKGSISVEFAPEEQAAKGAVIKLLKLADVTADGYFAIDERFAESDLADLLAGTDVLRYTDIAGPIVEAAAEATLTAEPDVTAEVDETGKALFEDVAPGLYLVSGDPIEIGDYIYTPLKAIVCVPVMEESGAWDFDQEAILKWEKRDAERINLKVLKVWSDISRNLHQSDSVTVHLYKGDDLFDTQELNQANNWTYTWNKLDPKFSWSLVEDKLENYDTKVERDGDSFVVTNTYNGPEENPPLPATGLLWWPMPILLAAGVAFILIGFFLRRKGSRNED